MKIVHENPAIVGEAVAGDAAQTRKQLEDVIQLSNKSLFDIAELAYKVKKYGYYEGHTTFIAYLKHLSAKTGFKERRLRYLTRMSEVMTAVGIDRATYEPLGVSKLREITTLDPDKTWVNPETKEETPIAEFIKGFVEKGHEMPFEEIQGHVRTLKGMVGEDAMGWVHLYMKQIVIDKVAKPALEKAKLQIGSVGKDDEGNSLDPSDGQAAEVVFVAFINEETNETS